MRNENLSMLFDYYEMTMSNGYFLKDQADKIVYFDVFFRNVPDNGGFAIACGLESVCDYINNLHFDEKDIAYLESKKCFSKEFLDYLKDFKFHGDIYAVKEGTIIFPNEPIITVRAKAIEAQLLETFLLLTINHQSLIATKASRIVRAANGRAVMEFGSRRAQGPDAAILGAKAAYIAGCVGTACTLTDELYGVPALGTMAHSWVQMYDSEYEAFKAYCEIYPHNACLLVDTYNTLKSGVPNAIKAIKEVLLPLGITNYSVRLDSGDIAYLTKETRKMLDAASLPNCKIVVSNSLDEYLIANLLVQGAKIDSFGVGERLITSKTSPVFDGVYKLVAVEEDGQIIPKIKISENIQKITNPGFKKIVRIYDKKDSVAIADLLCLKDEVIDDSKPLTIFDPNATWKKKTLTNYFTKEIMIEVFKDGKQVYELPSIKEVKAYCQNELDHLWDEIKRFENPHTYYVDLSEKLFNIKEDLLMEHLK